MAVCQSRQVPMKSKRTAFMGILRGRSKIYSDGRASLLFWFLLVFNVCEQAGMAALI